MSQEALQESVNASISGRTTIRTGLTEKNSVDAFLCGVCLRRMRPGRHGSPKRFCSIECRRLAWALRLLSAALEAGEAEGLRQTVSELGRRT